MTKFPCKDCADRSYSCHSSCEKYAEAQAKRCEELELRREYKKMELYFSGEVLKRRAFRARKAAKR